jgi:nanoRNase/pAp phosphatase (c-di-AMP/oligoRNAs hydrolase)
MLDKYGLALANSFPSAGDACAAFDLGVALDTAVKSTRAGGERRAETRIIIDHHPMNPRYGDPNYRSDLPATQTFELIQVSNCRWIATSRRTCSSIDGHRLSISGTPPRAP